MKISILSVSNWSSQHLISIPSEWRRRRWLGLNRERHRVPERHGSPAVGEERLGKRGRRWEGRVAGEAREELEAAALTRRFFFDSFVTRLSKH
jgi:hypothetical protein